ncbi:MAG: V4R domain-containing protein [Candidatus Jordarchaeales archaeon]
MAEELSKDIKSFIDGIEIDESGALSFKGRRFVFVPGVLFSISLMGALVERYSKMLEPVRRRALVNYGRKLAEKMEALGAKGVLEYYLSLEYLMGFGRNELIEFGESQVVFRVYSSLYGEETGAYFKMRGVQPSATCSSGYVAEGILNYFAEKDGKPLFTSEEVKCKAKGDEYCEFVLKRSLPAP